MSEITLKEYFEHRMDDLKLYHDKDVTELRRQREEVTKGLKEFLEQQLLTIDRTSRDKATAMEKRLEGMNELRGAMKDQASQFAERKELMSVKENLEKDIRILREAKAETHGKSEQTGIILAVIFSILGVVLSVLAIVLKVGLI